MVLNISPTLHMKNNILVDSGFNDFDGDFDHFEQIMREDYQRLPDIQLIIERLDKIRKW